MSELCTHCTLCVSVGVLFVCACMLMTHEAWASMCRGDSLQYMYHMDGCKYCEKTQYGFKNQSVL